MASACVRFSEAIGFVTPIVGTIYSTCPSGTLSLHPLNTYVDRQTILCVQMLQDFVASWLNIVGV